MTDGISPAQLKKLQTLWGIAWDLGTISISGADLPAGSFNPRVARMCFLTRLAKREITTSKDLTRLEAEAAIHELMKIVPEKFRGSKRRLSGSAAQTLGSRDGGKDQLADRVILGHIADLKARLGWDNQRFEAFLRSPKSPLRGRTQIRTLADAKAVRWALNAIAKRMERGAAA